MRLTLRTLLAYRDRVLPAAELEQMHARVQQSVLASNLIKRIHALGQRTNLLAPPIEGKGLGADANSIAEYLDDSLSGEKVPELERICLESDVQLAELAQCHSMLSQLLSATVDVAPELRERIVGLSDPDRRLQLLEQQRLSPSDGRPVARPVNDPLPPAVDQASPRAAALVASERFRTAAANQLASDSTPSPSGSLADPVHADSVHNNPTHAVYPAAALASPMVASGGDSIRTRGLDLEGAHLAHEVPEYLRGRSRDGWLGPLAIGALLALLCLLVWQTVGSWQSVREMLAEKPTPSPAAPSPAVAPAIVATPAATAQPNSAAGSTVTGSTPGAGVTASAATTPAAGVPNDISSAIAALGSTSNSSTPIPTRPAQTDPTAATPNPNPLAAVAKWLPADDVGGQAVILVHIAEHDLWRLQPAENIYETSQVFIPPFMRPKLDLSNGMFWAAGGLSHLQLNMDKDQVTPRIELRLGRAILTSPPGGSSLELITPAGNVKLTLLDADARLAIELSYPASGFGSVIDRQVHAPTLTLTSLEGSCTVETGAAPTALTSGKALILSGTQLAESQPPAEPAWVDASSERTVDLLAAQDLAKQLSSTEPIGPKLVSLATNRRPEMRALAAQTLALLGSWEWVADPKSTLSDARDRSFWSPTLAQTRQILAAHPENAPALQAALTSLDASTAGWRHSMWLGLTQAQLQSDGLLRLAKSLESDALIERVLAIYNLERATGKTLGFQPGESNRAVTQAWSRELTSGRAQLLPAPGPEL